MPRPLTAAESDLMHEAAAAEACGDAARAYELYQSIRPFAGNHHSEMLRQLVELEEFLPPWACARWIAEQALRHYSVANEERCRDVRMAAIHAAHWYGVDQHQPYDESPETFVGLMTGCDWVYRQLFLYDEGGLRHFLETGVGEELRARADLVDEWPSAAMGGYRLVRDDGETLAFEDLAGGSVEVPNIGSASELWPGDTCIGRLVPISGEPGLMFESRPLAVDDPIAGEVADSPDDWLAIIRGAHRDGFLRDGFSWRRIDTQPLLTDLAEIVWRTAMYDDIDTVHRRFVQGERTRTPDAVRLLRGVLAGLHGRHLEVVEGIGPYAASALLAPGVLAQLRKELVLPQYAWPWRLLADTVADPARAVCRDLARQCEEFGGEEFGGEEFGLEEAG